MRTLRCNALLALLFLSSISTLVYGGSGQKVLLLVKSGGNENLEDLWRTAGGIRDLYGNGSLEHITSLLPLRTFRSKEIENLRNDPPQKIYFQALDSQGNVIWETGFLTSNSIFNELFILLIADDIDGQSSYFPPRDVGVYWSSSEYQMAIHPLNDSNYTYFSIWDNPGSTNSPLFLFPRRKDLPQRLQKGVPGVYEYYGCFQALHMDMTTAISNSATMDVDLCAVACTPTAKPYLGIETNRNCHCGDFSKMFTPYDMGVAFCNTYTCAGTGDLCGGPLGYFAVYFAAISLPIPAIEPAIPQRTLFINISYINVADDPVDITPYTSLPVYITTINLEVNEVTGTLFIVHYSQVHSCNSTHKKTVMDSSQTNVKKFSMGTVGYFGIIEACCIWIEFAESSKVPTGATGILIIEHIDPSEAFVSAPFIAVVAEGFTETTTTPTTAEATTTIPTIAEATTTKTIQTTTAESQSTTTSSTGHTSTVTLEMVNSQLMTTAGDSRLTTNHQTTVETNTGSTSHVMTSLGICLCRCYKAAFNMTREELTTRLKVLRKELSVNVTELSSYIRKFISAPDDRPSAAGVGALGVVILAFVFGTIILLDLTTFLKLRK